MTFLGLNFDLKILLYIRKKNQLENEDMKTHNQRKLK